MSDINLSFTRNLKGVSWGGTVRLNLLRALGAGLVWAIFAYGLGASLTVILAVVVACPIAHLFIGMPLGVASYVVESSLGALVAVAVMPGDPFLYLVARLFPRRFPAQGLHLFQMTPVLLLTRVPSATQETIGHHVSSIAGDSGGFVE